MNGKTLQTILDALTAEELLCQLAEESAELAQAALKLVRARTGRNPTPKTERDCVEDLTTELADVMLSMRAVICACNVDETKIAEIMDSKAQRWVERLEGRKGEREMKNGKLERSDAARLKGIYTKIGLGGQTIQPLTAEEITLLYCISEGIERGLIEVAEDGGPDRVWLE